jgi:hypothetical protein
MYHCTSFGGFSLCHLVGARGHELKVDSDLLELLEVGASPENRLSQGFDDVLVRRFDAPSSVGAAMREESRLVDVEAVGRGDVSMGIDDHAGLLFVFLLFWRAKPRARTPSR